MSRFLRFSNAPVTGILLAVILVMYGVEVITGALDNPETMYRLGAIYKTLITEHQ